MTPTTHYEYLSHLSTQMINNADKRIFWEHVGTYTKEFSILAELSLDSVRESLADLYCPTGNGNPKDPCAMLRSWLLMTLCREGSPTVWATRLRREPALAGFASDPLLRDPTAAAPMLEALLEADAAFTAM